MSQQPEPGDESERSYSTIWERMAGETTRPRVSLSYERIATAGVEIADSDGLQSVSMRKLAQRLGVATMATYRYVSTKDDLYELMLDACHAELQLTPDALTDWRSALLAYAEAFRGMIIRHPWITQVPELLPGNLTPHLVVVVEQVLTTLSSLRIDVDSRMAMVASTSAFVQSAVAAEMAQRHLKQRYGWKDDDERRSAYHPYMSQLTGTGEYPHLTDYLVNGTNLDDGEWQFQFGLQCLLEGMSARLDI